ncbi:MAG: DNA gyrase subunit A [Pegethrix bostrychoides GSE-TBD4-15B]|jgi:DNA gyrase subunit A|uniref:DNA topoisomerase (ATP-hydrolyzing) n=1 Tax=Pegethrix bostrychoides GSE-TBD4-15B TaxID=2839662 RepID=A0A951U704_9CYAN|nr:DNA gyrase subunit A [Pegethrix bostrychoides GSE-TBD4-15B]
MAEQLSILSVGQVIPTALHTEVQQSYLEYAMSVIVGRALPDVRDGLKPVHRRILYAMHELGLTPDRPYRKCARVVGDVLGKYHPHGDQSVYDALVRMVQDFSSRYPLLQGHGNFGSVDDDPPAAMRYTETRLAPIGNEGLLSEIGEATVDFIGNFDNSQQEPMVLPAQLPYLLLNGCSGIAVGMATNIPPHNAGEVIDGLIALIDRPDLSDDELIKLIPAPDFPTGGEIISSSGIRDAYSTGRGSIAVRGVTRLEEIDLGRGRQRRTAIIVTELPFQVNKASWIEKIAELVNLGKIEGIADIRDESDRDGMRVVIELRRDTQPDRVLERLYKLTPLQTNFGAIMLAISDGQPRQMPLREILQQFLAFREATLTRQYRHELEKTEARAHVLEGLLLALDELDAMIAILRRSPDGATARLALQDEFSFSERQASAILSMPLSRLTGLERQKLQEEFAELTARMAELHRLLDNRKELLKSLKKDLRSLKKKFADPRRTRLLSQEERAEETAKLAEIIEEEAIGQELVLEFTHKGYVRRYTPKAFQKRQQAEPEEALEDFAIQVEEATTGQELLLLTRSGKAFTTSISEIPVTVRQMKGTPLISLLPLAMQADETVMAQFVLGEDTPDLDLIMLTQQGRLKRLPLSEFQNLSGRGLTALKLKDDDLLRFAALAVPDEQLVIATSTGRILKFAVNDEKLPVMGRAAQGQQVLRVGRQESIVSCLVLNPTDELFLLTAQGYAKRMQLRLLRATGRGEMGTYAMQFALKTDQLVGAAPALPGSELTVMTDAERLLRIEVERVKVHGKDGAGDRAAKLNKKEKIVEICSLELREEIAEA